MEFYVDGSCLGIGNGGFGIVGFENEKLTFAYSKRNENTTNNREEIRAILYVLLNYGYDNPIVYSDSAYCVNTFTSWIYNWESRGWLKGDNKPPENLDLIQAFWELLKTGRKIQLKKVKGHIGILGNELADALATGKTNPNKIKGEYNE